MKKTDVIIPLDPAYMNKNTKSNLLQLVVLNMHNNTQLIDLNEKKYISVPVEEDEWVKLSIDKRETINVDYLGNVAPKEVFNYICYTLTPEKKTKTIDPLCKYFVGCSIPLEIDARKKVKSKLSPIN